MPWRRADLRTASRLNWTVGPTNSSRQVASRVAVGDGDEVHALAVAAVELLVDGHALLDAEDVVAQRQRRRHLGVAARAADLVGEHVGHRSA